MDEMTRRLYHFLIEYKSNNDGNSPNRDTMADAIGLRSKSGVNEYLDRLEALGKIKRGGKGVARDIRVVGGKWLAPGQTLVDPLPQMKEGHERDSTWDEEMGIEDWDEEDGMKRES